MNNLERINALLKLNVFIRELSPIFGLTQLLLDQLLSALGKRGEVRTIGEMNR